MQICKDCEISTMPTVTTKEDSAHCIFASGRATRIQRRFDLKGDVTRNICDIGVLCGFWT